MLSFQCLNDDSNGYERHLQQKARYLIIRTLFFPSHELSFCSFL